MVQKESDDSVEHEIESNCPIDAVCLTTITPRGSNVTFDLLQLFFPLDHWGDQLSCKYRNYLSPRELSYFYNVVPYTIHDLADDVVLSVKWDHSKPPCYLSHYTVFLNVTSVCSGIKGQIAFVELIRTRYDGPLTPSSSDLDLRVGLLTTCQFHDIQQALRDTKNWVEFWEHLSYHCHQIKPPACRRQTVEIIASFRAYADSKCPVNRDPITETRLSFRGNARWWILRRLQHLLCQERVVVKQASPEIPSSPHQSSIMNLIKQWAQLPDCLRRTVTTKLDDRCLIFEILSRSLNHRHKGQYPSSEHWIWRLQKSMGL